MTKPSSAPLALALPAIPLAERRIATNGVHLHVVEAGPTDGPLVLLLHGFPEFWRAWGAQIEPLVQAGYRVWVVDQRGYNLSDKPAAVDAYNLTQLSDDVVGLMDAAGAAQAAVIGHDWGAAVAWWTANRFPERVRCMVAMNAPHPVVWLRLMSETWRQRLRSGYVAYFQLPRLPELSLRAGNWRATVRSMRNSARPGVFSDGDADLLRSAWSQPGAMTAMLNWYRAARHLPRLPSLRVEPPTLVVWGANDAFLERRAATETAALCRQARVQLIEDATHWVHHEEPARVSALLLEFLKAQMKDSE